MRKGQKASPGQRRIYSEAAKRRVIHWTPEMRKRRSEIAIKSNTNRVVTLKTRQKTAQSLMGRKDSLSTRLKKSLWQIGEKIQEKNPNRKGAFQTILQISQIGLSIR